MSDYYREPEAVLPLFAAARRTDPPTSHKAAQRAPVSGHRRLVLDALAAGPAGQTEIARRAGITVAAVSQAAARAAACRANRKDGARGGGWGV